MVPLFLRQGGGLVGGFGDFFEFLQNLLGGFGFDFGSLLAQLLLLLGSIGGGGGGAA